MTTTICSLLGMGMNFSKKRHEVKCLFIFPFILGREIISIFKKICVLKLKTVSTLVSSFNIFPDLGPFFSLGSKAERWPEKSEGLSTTKISVHLTEQTNFFSQSIPERQRFHFNTVYI